MKDIITITGAAKTELTAPVGSSWWQPQSFQRAHSGSWRQQGI